MRTRRTRVRLAVATGIAAAAVLSPLTASAAPSSVSADDPHPKHQLRAMWVASVDNLNWPSEPGLSVAEQKRELRSLLNTAAQRGMNAVMLQVRPTADTFWPSDLEPWSHWLTGKAGQDPGYDPLAFATREAHARGLALHAWFNPYRVTMQGTDLSVLPPDHPARLHPNWVVGYGGKLYYNPGIPAVRQHVERVVMEATQRYDIDGVHFDDYFYPYPVQGEVFDDRKAFQRYSDGYTDLHAWRRHNIDLLVSELDAKIHRAKPWVSFGISPFAVWRNASTDPAGSQTEAGAQTYDDLYADTRLWVKREWVDYVAPQVYWALGFEVADYAKLVPWWDEQVAGTDVHLYIGHANYKVGASTQSPAWNNDSAEISNQMTFNRDYAGVDGDIFFDATSVVKNALQHMDLVQEQQYARPALPPVTVDADQTRPAVPTSVRTAQLAGGVRISWQGAGRQFVVYRFDSAAQARDPHSYVDASYVVRVTPVGARTWIDTAAEDGSYYVVSAVSRSYREGQPSDPVAAP